MNDRLSGLKGWSQSGTLHTRQKGESVSLQADFKTQNEDGTADNTAGYYTIQFNVTPPKVTGANANDNGAFRAQASIQWSVEGNTVERFFDIGNGLSISGCGQSVKVVVLDNTPPANEGGPGTSGYPYEVTIQISPGTRPTTGQLPTLQVFLTQSGVTAPQQAIAPGTPLVVDISNIEDANGIQHFPGAISVEVPFTDTSFQHGGTPLGAGGGIEVEQENFAGGQFKSYFLALGEQPVFVDLSPDTTHLVITAVGAMGSHATVAVILGIDG